MTIKDAHYKELKLVTVVEEILKITGQQMLRKKKCWKRWQSVTQLGNELPSSWRSGEEGRVGVGRFFRFLG